MKTPTDEQLSLAMCEWMGWNPKGDHWQDFRGKWTSRETLPDYLSDESPRRLLNDAEARLTTEQRGEYTRILGLLVCSENRWVWHLITATARQRVIALLQTIKPEIFQ